VNVGSADAGDAVKHAVIFAMLSDAEGVANT
jgi:hypothetical protein